MTKPEEPVKSPNKSPTDANVKKSRWKFFPSSKPKPDDLAKEDDPKAQSSPDSTYSSAQPSDNEGGTTTAKGLQIPKETLGRTSPVHSEGTVTYTTPTIRKETHHDPRTGTAITTVVTTTTTTTTIIGPNGTTVIEEPRAELGDGRRTPDPSKEAIDAAVNGGGNGNLDQKFGTTSQPYQWNPITPGRRPIPQKDPNGSVSDLRHQVSHDTMPVLAPHPMSSRFSNVSAMESMPSPIATEDGRSSFYNPPQLPPKIPANQHQRPPSNQWNNVPPQLQPGNQPPQQMMPPQQPPMQHLAPGQKPERSKSPIAGIKRVAIGMHGAGEALRGSISQTADRKLAFGKPTEQKVQKMYKHQQLIDQGKYQIEHRKFVPKNNPVPAPAGPGVAPGNRYYANGQPPTPISPVVTQPDGRDNHLILTNSNRRHSSDLASQPKENDQPKGAFGKWLHKARSHPSDKNPGQQFSSDDSSKDNRLRRRSKLGPVAEQA